MDGATSRSTLDGCYQFLVESGWMLVFLDRLRMDVGSFSWALNGCWYFLMHSGLMLLLLVGLWMVAAISLDSGWLLFVLDGLWMDAGIS